MNRLLTRLLTGKKRAKSPDLTALNICAALQQRVQRLEIALAECDERLVKLQGHHKSLRGKVYGDRTDNSDKENVTNIPFGDKAALRKAAGIRAGMVYKPEE